MQSEAMLQYLLSRKDVLQNSLSKNPLQIVQAEEAKRTRRAKEEKSRRGKEEKLRQVEEEKSRQVEEEKLRRGKEEKLRRGKEEKLRRVEEEKSRQAEKEKSRQAEEEKLRRVEEEKSRQAEEEKLRQVEEEKSRRAKEEKSPQAEEKKEHNSRAVQQRSVDWDSPVFSNDRAKNLTIVHQWMAEKFAASKRCPCSHTNSSVFSVPTRPQSLSEDAKVQKEKATRLKVDKTSKKESRSLNSSSLFWLLLGAFIVKKTHENIS